MLSLFYFQGEIMTPDLFDDEDKKLLESLAIDLQTLRAATNDFSLGNEIGQGGFGTVYKVCIHNVAAVLIDGSVRYIYS
jgi:hypothetical protein